MLFFFFSTLIGKFSGLLHMRGYALFNEKLTGHTVSISFTANLNAVQLTLLFCLLGAQITEAKMIIERLN